jgi:hypothetical protein
MHRLGDYKVAGPLRGKHLLNTSLAIGKPASRLSRHDQASLRWDDGERSSMANELVRIGQ